MTANSAADCEQSLKTALQRLEDISIQTDSWCWETDENHVFSFFTENVERLTNLKKSELLGTSRLEMAQNSDEPHWQAHAKALLRQSPFDRFSYTRKNPKGEIRTIVVTGWPIYDETGVFRGYRGTGWDETAAVSARNRQVRKEEQLLSEIERQRSSLDTVLQNLGQSVIWFDEDGYIRLKNARTAKMMGFDPIEYQKVCTIQQHLRLMAERGDFGDVDVDKEVETRTHRLCKEITKPVDYRIHLATDDRYLDVSIRPLADGSRILTHTDVTVEAKNAEIIEDSDTKLKEIIGNIDYGVVLMDEDLSVEFVNEKFREIVGFSQAFFDRGPDFEEVLDKIRAQKVFKLTVSDDAHWRQYVARRRNEIVGGKMKTNERLLTDGRTVIETSVTLSSGKRMLTFVDITDLKSREALFELLVNNIDYATLVIDREQNVELWNKKFAEMMDFDNKMLAKKLSMKDVLDELHANDCTGYLQDDKKGWKQYRDNVLAVLKKGGTKPAERIRRDGKTVIHTAIVLPDGKRLMTYLDISEHKAREEKLREMQGDLKAANEMLEERVDQRTKELRKTQATLVKKERQALLGDLVASLCHELRNPLNALNTSMFIVRRRVEKDFPKLEKAFDRSERTIERCTSILDDLYEYALTGEMKFEPVDVEKWLIAEAGKVNIPRAFNIEFQFDLGASPINFDEKHMASAINKIISNAAQAVADNLDPTGRDPKIKISARQVGDRLVFSVADNGPGMAGDVRQSALEPLYSTRGFGVGLGLPIAEQTALRHGGGIELQSVEGEGTVVTLWIPINSQAEQAA